MARPPIVAAGTAGAAEALAAGAIIGVPAVGGYYLAMRAGLARDRSAAGGSGGRPGRPSLRRRIHRGPALADVGLDRRGGPAARALLARPPRGVPARAGTDGTESADAGGEPAGGPAGATSGSWAVVVGMPDGRALRRLCRDYGPWRTVPLSFTEAQQVAQAFDAAAVALVVDGGAARGRPQRSWMRPFLPSASCARAHCRGAS